MKTFFVSALLAIAILLFPSACKATEFWGQPTYNYYVDITLMQATLPPEEIPKTVEIVNTVITNSFKAWQVPVQPVFMGTVINAPDTANDGFNVVSFNMIKEITKNGHMIRSSVLAETMRYWDDQDFDKAIEADINVNIMFNWDSLPWGVMNDNKIYSFLEVMTHEIGHLLGSEHATRTSSIMFPTLRPIARMPDPPDARDIKYIQSKYHVSE